MTGGRDHAAEQSADSSLAVERSSRPRMDPAVNHVLALQASAGNAATSRLLGTGPVMVAREPAAAPTLDSRTMAVTLQPTLETERDAALKEYHAAGEKLAQLQQFEETGEITEKGRADRALLEKVRDEQLSRYSKAESDLRLLTEPGASDQVFNDLLARRGSKVSAGESTDSTSSGWRVGESGITSSNKEVSSQVADGKSTTTTTSSASTIDTTGWSKRDSTSTATVSGATTSTESSSTTRKVDVTDLSYSKANTTSSSTTADGSSSAATTTSQKWGAGGVTTSTEKSTVEGGKVTSTKDTAAFSRGDGKLGASTGSSTKTGTQDSDGNLIKGRESSGKAGGGVIAGPGGVGGYGSAEKDFSQTHAKGVKTGQSVGMDGKFVVNVSQLPDKVPVQYQISLTVNLGVKAGVSGSGEQEAATNAEHGKETFGKGSKGNASAKLSGSASVTGTFVHVFSESETKTYLGALASNGAGGAQQELQALALAHNGQAAAAQAMLTGLKASLLSADGAAAMTEGDSAELAADAKGDAKLSVGGSGGFLGGTLDGSYGKSGSVKRSVARRDGKIVITVTALTSGTTGGGATVSAGAASGGGSYSVTDSAGQTVSFTLDPNDSAYRQHFGYIAGANLVEELRKLADAYPELVGSRTDSTGTASTQSTTAGAGGVTATLTNTHAFNETTTRDASGTTYNATGSSGGGISAGLGESLKAGYSKTDNVSGTVGADGKASGDASTATSGTSYGASWSKFWDKLSDNPIGTVTGLVTGGTKIMEEESEVAGMKLSDSDYQRIASVAQNDHDWREACYGGQHREAWMQIRFTVAASVPRDKQGEPDYANLDRKKIVKALATYAKDHDNAAQAISIVVRGDNTAQGGTKYNWPGELSAEKSTFAALIDGDPFASARTLRDAGQHQQALEAVEATVQKIDKLSGDMQSKRDKFSDTAAYLEMLTRVATRRGDAAKHAADIRNTQSLGGKSVPLPPPGVTTVPTAEQAKAIEIDREEGKAALAGYQYTLNAFLTEQTRVFNLVDTELAKDNTFFGRADNDLMRKEMNTLRAKVFPEWEAALTKARDAARKAGVDEWSIQPVPARNWWDVVNGKINKLSR